MSTGSAATGVADAAEQMAEEAAADLFGALPEASGLVKAAVAAAQARRRRGRDIGYNGCCSGCGGVALLPVDQERITSR